MSNVRIILRQQVAATLVRLPNAEIRYQGLPSYAMEINQMLGHRKRAGEPDNRQRPIFYPIPQLAEGSAVNRNVPSSNLGWVAWGS